ncbi:helix-turn-helix domain-containing protein [Draconibacterium sp. IB214405]|uniref:helix-turn-helix transcriptional regulator n=1 Tax=Draconibacterium sp. IB214405 TaxID=3097352 RepID=UPI002A0B4A61|nr:helix-turn-helix domain-containing protein [Draconibacterium sp. IB214405]MDX8339068.1 helix-turn-helix domain-containing protein [Draconibacterium sp. IB214405]
MFKLFESLPQEVALLRQDVEVLQKLIEVLINSPNDQAEVISVEDVVRLTGYTKNTIYQYANKGIIPTHRPLHGGRKLVFYRSEIENWLRGNKPETSEEFCERKETELINYYKGGLN